MKLLMRVVAILLALSWCSGCDVRPGSLEYSNLQDFANEVECARGYKNKCWCFVATRRGGLGQETTSIGMALGTDDLCDRPRQREE